MQIFIIKKRSCKLSFLLPPHPFSFELRRLYTYFNISWYCFPACCIPVKAMYILKISLVPCKWNLNGWYYQLKPVRHKETTWTDSFPFTTKPLFIFIFHSQLTSKISKIRESLRTLSYGYSLMYPSPVTSKHRGCSSKELESKVLFYHVHFLHTTHSFIFLKFDFSQLHFLALSRNLDTTNDRLSTLLE